MAKASQRAVIGLCSGINLWRTRGIVEESVLVEGSFCLLSVSWKVSFGTLHDVVLTEDAIFAVRACDGHFFL